MKNRILKLVSGIAVFCLCNSASAALLDFTDDTFLNSLTDTSGGAQTSYAGTFDGVGFTLSSTNGPIRLFTDGGYDGADRSICASNGGQFACDTDGIGIVDDEVGEDIGGDIEPLTLTFDTAVYVSGFHFIDLYVGDSAEEATIVIGGTTFQVKADQVGTIGQQGQGGYAESVIDRILATTITFTAIGNGNQDNVDNNYALAGVNVSAVPIPAAAWLFVSGIVGLMGFSTRRKSA